MVPTHHLLAWKPFLKLTVELHQTVLSEGQVGRAELGVLGLDGVFYDNVQPAVSLFSADLADQHTADLVFQVTDSVSAAA
jgi:hypothetical protein